MSGRTSAALRRRLLTWYRRSRRDLPWRRTRDPYAIWISEAMLQQTRVETVIPYYERFLARFPDLGALAAADLEDVLGAWAGLGYYGRARNLHRAARVLDERGASGLPDDPEALRALPGVGRYTAGAIASIAFDRSEPVVDGNVARVFARVFGIRAEIGGAAVQGRLWREAEALVKGPHPGELNQALMELGATVCTPRSPTCPACPVARLCDARAAGDAEELPRKARKAAPRRVEATAVWLMRNGRVLAVRRPPEGLLGGLWELPGGDLAASEPPAAGLRRALTERVGLELLRPRPLGEVEHVFSHLRLRLHVFRADASPGRVRRRGFDAHRWLSPAALAALPQGAVTRKALRLCTPGPEPRGPARRAGDPARRAGDPAALR